MGAPGSGTPYYSLCGRLDMENHTGFLPSVYAEYGKFVIFLDNTSYHKSKKLKEFLGRMGGRIRIYYLPPYAPELNSVGVQ